MPSEKFNLTEWLKNLFKKEPKNSEQEQVTDKRIPLLNAEITKLKETISETNKILSEKETEISTLKELAKTSSTPLDEYCIKSKYKTVKKVVLSY